ncbi:hypothetical protein Hanom_Chr16g01478711 [Helianthus anomalus]
MQVVALRTDLILDIFKNLGIPQIKFFIFSHIKKEQVFCKYKSKLSFWSLWFGHLCHFSPNLKLFTSGSLWFAFCCHFSPKSKNPIFLPLQPPILSFSSGAFW